jgi:hypothetical protein
MLDWLKTDIAAEGPIGFQALALQLVLSLFLGGLVAVVYRISHGREKPEAVVMQTTLVLLCVLIALVSLVIGNSVARAFSLVGALSIVRFRTVVDYTRDTAFVIFAVIVGMAVGTGQYLVPVAGIPTVAVAAVLLNYLGQARRAMIDGTLTVRMGLGRDPGALLQGPLAAHVQSHRLLSVGTTKQGAALEMTYAVRLKSETSLAGLVTVLNQIEGIQGVEIRRSAS